MNKTHRVVVIACVDVAAAVCANLVADAIGQAALGRILLQAILAVGLTVIVAVLKGETGNEKLSSADAQEAGPTRDARRNSRRETILGRPLNAEVQPSPLPAVTRRPTAVEPAVEPTVAISQPRSDNSTLRWTAAVAIWVIGILLVGSFLYPLFKDDPRLLATLKAGDSRVTDISFKGNDTLCSVTNQVRTWNLSNFEQVSASSQNDWIDAYFLPRCELLAAINKDKSVAIRSTEGSRTAIQIPAQSVHVNSVAFDRSGTKIATASQGAKVWSRDGKLIGEARDEWNVTTVALSPDGRHLVTGGEASTALMHSVPGMKVERKLESTQYNATWALAFSVDSKIIAVAGKAGVILLFDVSNGRRIQTFNTQDDGIWFYRLAFSPDRKLLASGDSNGDVRIWQVSTGEQLGKPLGGHKYSVHAMSFSPDGKLFASGGDEGEVRLWDLSKR
ncbi:WD40 repeat domain-containing protein [Micromonospora sp. SD19]